MSTTAAPATNGSSNALNSSRQPKMNTSAKGVEGQLRKPGSPVDGGQRKPLQQKAWTQGTNPITQRSSNGIVNPPNKPAAAQAQVQSASSSSISSGDPMKHLSDRMMYLLAHLIGLPGIITLKNGEKYSGVLSGTSLDPTEMRYVFKMVKRLLPAANAQTNGAGDVSDDYVGVGDYHVMSFDMSDVADFNVNNVVLDKTHSKGQNGVSSGFRTDTDISGHMSIRERNLQKWEPSADTDSSLSLEPTGRSTDWDQFATNEQLFGLKSNYDESFYTTTIDRSNPEYAARAARAEKIAREIEGSSATNAHVREERGQSVADDKGGDEEDKYSGVRRDFPPLPTGQPNKYTPPARRPPTGQPTVPGAPVDPAIISSQIARPEKATPPAEKRATPEPAARTEAPKVEAKAEPAKSEAPKDVAAAKTEAKANVAPTKPAVEQAQKPSAALKPTVAGIPARRARPDNATANVEHELLDSFKQFSAAEKLRMSERQRNIARESKAVKLNDLKKFSLNFKLNTPVPTDLVPILAKDETKQAQIVEKALRTVKELSSTPPKPAATTVDAKAGAKAAAPAAAKPDTAATAHASPSATLDRNQQRGPRGAQGQYASATMGRNAHQNVNQPRGNHGLLSTRLQFNQQQHKQQGSVPYNNVPQPIPIQDVRAPPTGPSQQSSGVQTPTSSASARFNPGARDFKPNPAAHTFQPGGNPSSNSSPRPDSAPRQPSEPQQQQQQQSRRTPAITAFFIGGQRPPVKPLDLAESFNAIKRLEKEAQDGDKTHNGGIQPPFRTPPTWDFPETHGDKGYKQMFEHSAAPTAIAAPHSGMTGGPMPHQHQLPPHLQGPQGVPQNQNPHHTPRGPPVQPHHGQGPHHFEAQHMQFSHSTSSVHPSPRPMPPYMYGSQPQPMPGFPQQVPMQHYGMSPGVQHVALRGAQGGPQFVTPPGPAMGGQMMTNQPSNGPFMGMPTNPQMPMYSPAPGPAYPQYPGHIPTGPGANGFPSPRPGAPMMTHQGSQQGHQQQPVMYIQQGGQGPPMFQVPPGSMTPMRGPYAQPHQPHYGSPHQHQQFPHQAHRGTPSGSYSQPMMQQHSMPPQGPPTGPANHGPEGSEEPK